MSRSPPFDTDLTAELHAHLATTSEDVDFEVLFQSENLNLQSQSGMFGVNEMFNQVDVISSLTLDKLHKSVDFVMVIRSRMRESLLASLMHPHHHAESSKPTASRELSGTLTVRCDEQDALFPITGMICASIMSVDRTELHFKDCEPFQTYVREFSVWNR